jgi:hypothetical protein
LYNVKVSWEDGSGTWEPLNIIGKDDPATTALFAKEHDLLERQNGSSFVVLPGVPNSYSEC